MQKKVEEIFLGRDKLKLIFPLQGLQYHILISFRNLINLEFWINIREIQNF